MSKGFQQFYNVFAKNKSKLETDAVPTTGGSDQPEPINTNSSIGSIPPDSQSNLEMIEPNRMQPESSVELFNPITNPATNNMLAVNHTQGQIVNQFSHINKLHLGSTIVFNGGAAGGGSAPQRRKKTRSIDAMMHSEEKLSQRMLKEISKYLGEGWQFVMRDLGFTDSEIHYFKVDYKDDGGLQEIIYQLLLDWTRNSDNPTLGKITKILWKLKHDETLNFMKIVWKEENSKSAGEEPAKQI